MNIIILISSSTKTEPHIFDDKMMLKLANKEYTNLNYLSIYFILYKYFTIFNYNKDDIIEYINRIYIKELYNRVFILIIRRAK